MFPLIAVEFENVSFSYPDTHEPAIRGINLEIEAGEFLGVVGASGSGKSTLCMCINGLIPRFFSGELVGTVRVFGRETGRFKPGELTKLVGMVFQNPDSQLFSSTVENEVAFGPENLMIPKEEILRRVNSSLERVGISDLRLRSPENLSGGEKQLVAIASTLAMEPDILVLDEPASQLDPQNRELVLNTIRRLHEEGMTVILVEHDTETLAEFADRIIVMKNGRIVCDGAPEEVFTDRTLLDAAGLLPPPVTRLSFMLQERGVLLEKLPVRFEDAYRVFSELIENGVSHQP
ncbi:MAG: energy-coupling factor ABC transporter ATP-binding protein [Candidatus Freyrarchaeum guaymaensis]